MDLCTKVKLFCLLKEVYSEPFQTCNVELFVKTVNSLKPLNILAKRSTLDVWQDPDCVSDSTGSKAVSYITFPEFGV